MLKQILKYLVLSYQKEGLAGTSPAKVSFDMTPTTEYNLWKK